jgi:hypothetical protein
MNLCKKRRRISGLAELKTVVIKKKQKLRGVEWNFITSDGERTVLKGSEPMATVFFPDTIKQTRKVAVFHTAISLSALRFFDDKNAIIFEVGNFSARIMG